MKPKPKKRESWWSRFRGPKGERGTQGPPGMSGPPGENAPRCSTCAHIGRLMEDVAALKADVAGVRVGLNQAREYEGNMSDLRAEIDEVQRKYKTKAGVNEWESAMGRIRNIELTVRLIAETATFKRGRPSIKIPWTHS